MSSMRQEIKRSRLKRLAGSAFISICLLQGVRAGEPQILAVDQVPLISQEIESRFFSLSERGPEAGAEEALQAILDDMQNLKKTAAAGIGESGSTSAQSEALKSLVRLSDRDISEDRILAGLIDIKCAKIAGGIDGAELIEATIEINRFLQSFSLPRERLHAGLAVAGSFAKSGNSRAAARYLRTSLSKGTARLEAADITRLSSELSGVIAAADTGLLSAVVLSISDGRQREILLKQVALVAGTQPASAESPSTRAEAWRAITDANGRRIDLWRVIDAQLDVGDDELAAILSQANAEFSVSLLEAAIDRRLTEGRAMRALRLTQFVLDDAKLRSLQDRIAQAYSDAGYHTMAGALAPHLTFTSNTSDHRFQLPTEIVKRVSAGDFEEAIALVQREPAANRHEAMAEIAQERAKHGDLPGALEMVRSIADYAVRVRHFREIAERQASSIDRYGLLTGNPAKENSSTGIKRPTSDFQQILGVDFDWRLVKGVQADKPNFHIPVADSETVRARVEAVSQGKASMMLARFNKRISLAGSSSGPDIGVFGDSLREYLFDTQNSVMPAILMVDTGVHTLGDLVKVASEMGTPGIVAEGDAYRISVPIFVRQGATLILSGLEAGEYRLDTHSGAFIMNAGTLVVTDTSLLAYDYRKGTPDVRTAEQQGSFRPFVTSWSGSRTEIANAELKNLGYFGGRSYGFTMASDPAYLLDINPDSKKPTGTIVDSTFENLVYGFYSYEAENVLLIGNEYRDNIIYGLDPHDRSNHLVLAYNTAYGSIKKHGGIISREVDDGLIVGNLTFANKGAGLMVERNSVGNVVYANTSFANGGDGISIYESPCNLVESNLSFSNGNAGIKIRNSWSVLVRANQLSHNKGAGLEAAIADVTGLKDAKERDLERDPFYTYSELDARLNEIEGNGSGILAKGASHITLDSNVFRSQTPDTFSGDLKAYRAQLVRPGLGLVHATTSSCIPARPLANKCPLEDLWSSGQQYTQRVTTNGSPSNDCTDQIGSIQERALNATQAELQSK